jgi:hypothetical protein
MPCTADFEEADTRFRSSREDCTELKTLSMSAFSFAFSSNRFLID